MTSLKAKKPKTPKVVTPANATEATESTPNAVQERLEVEKTKTIRKTTKSNGDLATSELAKKEKASKKKVNATQVEASTTNNKGKTEPVESAEETHNLLDQNTEEDDEESDIDDQTEALLKGFESDDEDEDMVEGEGFTEGKSIPKRKELTKKEEKKLKKIAESNAPEKPGVVYVGRIPHGFYEHEMRAYFKQFGNILKLRMSRNKKTGASRHYAWIQFESATVADIVARTMDNYLLFSHLLKVKIVPDDQIPEDLFKGANKRFKKVPWNKMAGRRLEQGASEEVWNARIKREEERRTKKAEILKEIGYDFEGPKLKPAESIVRKVDGAVAIDAA